MESDLSNPHFRLLLVLGFLIGVATSVFFSLFTAAPAHADTSCGQAQCYVDSTVRAESNWSSESYTGSDGSVVPGGQGGGATPRSLSTYKACDSWLPVGGGTSTSSYPAENSGRMTCNFADGGAMGGGTGVIWFQCPPLSDRAANGRVTYFIERVLSDGSTRWVYARYRCLYPTDAYAPIERMQGSGKVYTGGQGSFFHTSTSAASAGNTTYNAGGRLSNTTGYINRGVDLTRPEAFVGAWQPSFTAQTLTTNGQPVYGYYRLDWRLDYRICERWAYPSWLGVPARYDCSRSGTDTFANPYTYACNFNPPLQGGVRSDAIFIPSQCEPRWECVFSDPFTAGGHTDPITVMRNGQDIGVSFPTPGVQGAGIQNPRSWQFYNQPKANATPSLSYVKSSWRWNAWQTYSKPGTISFNWSSEAADRPFAWDVGYRFTADWWLPVQDAVGGGVRYQWVLSSAECPQTHSSPNISVVRSTNR